MDISSAISEVRFIIDDRVTPYLVSDQTIVDALSDAQREFARFTLCLYSASEEVSVSSSSAFVTIPDSVCLLRGAVSPTGKFLRAVTTVELDHGYFTNNNVQVGPANWRSVTGEPQFVVVDQATNQIRFVPKPTNVAPQTYTLEGYVVPAPLTISGTFTIPERYHENLVTGAVYYLYGTQSVEIADPNKAAEWRQRWIETLMMAAKQLNTMLRVPTRIMPLPHSMEFVNAIGGAAPAPTERQPNQ